MVWGGDRLLPVGRIRLVDQESGDRAAGPARAEADDCSRRRKRKGRRRSQSISQMQGAGLIPFDDDFAVQEVIATHLLLKTTDRAAAGRQGDPGDAAIVVAGHKVQRERITFCGQRMRKAASDQNGRITGTAARTVRVEAKRLVAAVNRARCGGTTVAFPFGGGEDERPRRAAAGSGEGDHEGTKSAAAVFPGVAAGIRRVSRAVVECLRLTGQGQEAERGGR